MKLELRFFATFREAVGRKAIEREFDDDATVGDVLRALGTEFDGLDGRFFDDDGAIREHVRILKNGRAVVHADGPDTDLTDGDTLSVFPPVAGGRGRRSTSSDTESSPAVSSDTDSPPDVA